MYPANVFPLISPKIRSLVHGPSDYVSSRTHMWHEGRHFRAHSYDVVKRRTQDSAIFTIFSIESRSSRNDVNVVREDIPYFGRIRHIWELSYDSFHEILFHCDWHKSDLQGTRATLVQDETRFWRVRNDHWIPSTRAHDEPFVYPRQVTQCAFIDAPSYPDWSYGIPYVPRSTLVMQLEEDEDIPRAELVDDYFS